ncbi:hypothetical protein AAZX31_02G268900 [Glycine max]|uniref:Uncharacterized protein n=1 Tax=Glycine max TaxID=3847 RepID=I1JJ36_SOYBN|nr:uncharacterized protein LOC100777386 [Glycine max]XP_006575653.1 uncharacterized protein LOC100777386 [Glycine max]KAH1062592.1 hypothetical protein GYH30_005518 [Glycine max]KAH1263656.1 hypothetical protein GmHk_02G005998 [Glycine max]KRH73638.1 hypothetical protein GLYMA_02G285800v4 [Glycine max]|eukprot:XP_003519544.1 uncharacterized protein LOC100777386 [Glycine max]
MILNCVRVTAMPMMAVPRWRSTCCCASSSSSVSTINTDQLRSQLDQLHAEADATRTKATNARLRLLRLSEAAEKLKKQAAISIQKGQENYAREMLFQRKKVLQALDKSKRRIELLDELSTKLSEAISLKESQLIGNVTVNIEDSTEDASSPVRIISPKEEVQNDVTKDDSDPDTMEFSDIQDVQLSIESEGSPLDDKETQNLLESLSISTSNEEYIARNLSEISSYEDFMEHIDKKLSEIEAELVTVLNVSTLVLDNEERPKNSRLQQTIELLESIHGIRQRIRSTKEAKLRI